MHETSWRKNIPTLQSDPSIRVSDILSALLRLPGLLKSEIHIAKINFRNFHNSKTLSVSEMTESGVDSAVVSGLQKRANAGSLFSNNMWGCLHLIAL